MPNTPEGNDPALWHKYFAIECNNRAWDLSIQERTPEQDAEMLDVAHTSAYHWNLVGVELNNIRAKMLLAEVHALLGLGDTALGYATEVKDYFSGMETDDWEIAFVHTIFAHAAHSAGKFTVHKEAYKVAKQALNAIADEEDRDIVQKTFDQVVQPKGSS